MTPIVFLHCLIGLFALTPLTLGVFVFGLNVILEYWLALAC